MLDWTNPATAALNEIRTAPLVRFSVLALSSIFFLVDPFAAIPSFLAITQSADAGRRKRMARKAALTCFIVLTSFALAGQLIFRMFGITLPAFEIAGGLDSAADRPGHAGGQALSYAGGARRHGGRRG